jgi:hypothetical protein
VLNDQQWWGFSRVTQWAWDHLFNKIAFALITSIMVVILLKTDRPLMALFAPIYFIPVVFAVILLNLASMFGDMWAAWVVEKIFAKPNPNNMFHQIVYFCISIMFLPFGLLLVTFGDTNNIPPY